MEIFQFIFFFTGECLYCFISPKDGLSIDDKVKAELKQLVREKIAPFAMPDYIQVCEYRLLTETEVDMKFFEKINILGFKYF